MSDILPVTETDMVEYLCQEMDMERGDARKTVEPIVEMLERGGGTAIDSALTDSIPSYVPAHVKEEHCRFQSFRDKYNGSDVRSLLYDLDEKAGDGNIAIGLVTADRETYRAEDGRELRDWVWRIHDNVKEFTEAEETEPDNGNISVYEEDVPDTVWERTPSSAQT